MDSEPSEIMEEITLTGITVRFVVCGDFGRFVLRKPGCSGGIQIPSTYDADILAQLKEWKEQE